MGVFSLGINGALLSNPLPDSSSFHGLFCFRPKPIFCNPLRFVVDGFDPRTPKPRIVNALSREADAGSAKSKVLENEFKFSPTFDDYLKVMESIRTDRGNDSSADVDASEKRLIGSSKGKEKLVRSKRNPFEERGTADRDGRDNELNDARTLASSRKQGAIESNASGWGLVEGILEKAAVRRSGRRSDGGLRDVGSSERNLNGGRENMGNGRFRKGEVRQENYGKSQNDSQRKWKDVQKVNESGFRNEAKVLTERRSYGKFVEKQQIGSNSGSLRQKSSHVDNTEEPSKGKWIREGVNRLTGEVDSYKIKPSEEKHVYRSNIDSNMGRYGRHNGSSGKETSLRSYAVKKSEMPVNAFASNRFYGIDTSKKSDTYEISKHKQHDTSLLRVERRKIDGNLKRSELKIQYIDTEHDMHADGTVGKRAGYLMYTPKKDLYTPSGEKFQQGIHRNHPKLYEKAAKTEKLASRASAMNRISGVKDGLSNKVVGRGSYMIDHENRAAFRTFEVLTDVKNRPRVLRMEMEERIEKLAKSLNATDINMPEWQFSKMMHSAKIKFTDHSILRVVQILGALGNWKRVLQVVEWLRSRDRFKSFKSRYIYTTALDVLGKAKKPVEALNIFYAMRQELSSYPDLAAYRCIAVTLGQAGLIKELFDVIDCMRAAPEKKFKLGPLQKWDPRLEPDLVIYNAVLNACVQQKQWEGVFWVLQQLKHHYIKPSNTTYGLAMEVMLACGKYSLVHELFRKVEKTSVPGVLNYKVLVNTFWREGKIDEAKLAVEDMERRGIVGSASLYYDLARCLCSAGRCQEALQQINKICKVAKKPLVVTYTGLIQACLDSGSIENSVYIFSQMHKFCSPNIITCNIMLKSYIEHGMFEEAKELFHDILDGIHHIESKASLHQKVIADKFTFNIMMEACATAKDWDEFQNTYLQMLIHDFYFDTKRHLRMVLDAFRAGKVEVLEATWEHLARSGRVQPPPIVKERFCMKLEEDNHVAAITSISTHQDIEMQTFSEKSWLSLIKSNASRFKMDTISRLTCEVSDLIAESDKPHPVFQNLLNACREFISLTKTPVKFLDDHNAHSHDLQLKS